MQEVTTVNNLGLSAYLLLKGYKLSGSPEFEKNSNRFLFSFEITKEKYKEMLYEYSTGDFSKFDAFVLSLKRMLPHPRRGV